MNESVSDTLYHFTKDLKTLQTILSSSELLLTLNKRQWRMQEMTYLQLEIPMACLTETPAQFLSGHQRTFGDYGIGFKIGWAISRGAQNVIYCEHDHINDFATSLLQILNHKPRFGVDLRSSMVAATEQMIYRTEREWRFIGRITNLSQMSYVSTSVKFELRDIVELYCPENEIEPMSKFANSIWGDGHGVVVKAIS